MNLLDVVHRQSAPKPWAEGEKIPWNDPSFSRRMLREHLSQQHNAASRRFGIIDRHVRWIHHQVLQGTPTRILDLGCGPGLYVNRLARLGHLCVGIDFSPASIAYAREQAQSEGLDVTYVQHDIRTVEVGDGYGLVMLIFGEFNVFRPLEARGILEVAYQALVPGGFLLLEPQTFEAVRKTGGQSASWYTEKAGLFSDGPHLCLQESFWDAESNVAIERFYIIDAASGEVARHSASTQAYTEEEVRSMLADCGFRDAQFGLPAEWCTGGHETDLTLVLSRKRPTA